MPWAVGRSWCSTLENSLYIFLFVYFEKQCRLILGLVSDHTFTKKQGKIATDQSADFLSQRLHMFSADITLVKTACLTSHPRDPALSRQGQLCLISWSNRWCHWRSCLEQDLRTLIQGCLPTEALFTVGNKRQLQQSCDATVTWLLSADVLKGDVTRPV